MPFAVREREQAHGNARRTAMAERTAKPNRTGKALGARQRRRNGKGDGARQSGDARQRSGDARQRVVDGKGTGRTAKSGRTAKIRLPCLLSKTHDKDPLPGSTLSSDLCRARADGKGVAVRIRAFAVRFGRMAMCCFPVVQALEGDAPVNGKGAARAAGGAR